MALLPLDIHPTWPVDSNNGDGKSPVLGVIRFTVFECLDAFPSILLIVLFLRPWISIQKCGGAKGQNNIGLALHPPCSAAMFDPQCSHPLFFNFFVWGFRMAETVLDQPLSLPQEFPSSWVIEFLSQLDCFTLEWTSLANQLLEPINFHGDFIRSLISPTNPPVEFNGFSSLSLVFNDNFPRGNLPILTYPSCCHGLPVGFPHKPVL